MKVVYDKLRPRNLVIISPTAPPEVCGVSDYAFALLKELYKYYNLVQLGVHRTPARPNNEISKTVSVEKWERQLVKAIRQCTPTDVILNYAPLSYNSFGYPKKLISILKRFKLANEGNRLFLFIHESWNGGLDLKIHHKLRDKVIKYSVRQIAKITNGVLVFTQEQHQKISSLFDKMNVHRGLISSNILPSSEGAGLYSERIKGQWVVFGLAHTRLWALETHLPILKKLNQQGRIKKIHAVGPFDNDFGIKELALMNEHFGTNFLVQLGVLAPEAVSNELLIAEASITGQTADSLKKSGTFAALAAHAVPVICVIKCTSIEPPIECLFRSEEVLNNVSILENENGFKKRELLHSWFWETRSWKAIGEDLHKWISGSINNL